MSVRDTTNATASATKKTRSSATKQETTVKKKKEVKSTKGQKYNPDYHPDEVFEDISVQNMERVIEILEASDMPLTLLNIRCHFKRRTSAVIGVRFQDYKDAHPEKFPSTTKSTVESLIAKIRELELENADLKGRLDGALLIIEDQADQSKKEEEIKIPDEIPF